MEGWMDERNRMEQAIMSRGMGGTGQPGNWGTREPGEWGMGNGEWGMGNGEWKVCVIEG